MTSAQLLPIAPEIFLALMGMWLLVWGAFIGDKATIRISVATMVVFAAALLGISHPGLGKMVTLGGHVGADGFTVLIKTVLLITGVGVLALSHHYLKASKLRRPEFPVLVLFGILGMMLMVGSESLLGLYVGLELQSLTLYVLAAFQRDNVRSSEAGLKYFVLGALASGLLLYGISLVYGATGTILFAKLHDITAALSPVPVELTLGLVFILAAMAFKMSAAPFHMWTPDAYQGAPTPVTAFFASAPKLAAFALLMKLLTGPFAGLAHQSQQILLVLAVASMAVGAFAALMQNNIKRLMAYSSIGHVGYALVGLVAGQKGLEATLLYLLIYIPMTLGTFAVILSLKRDDVYIENISDFAGLSKTRPVLAAFMAIFMFSMIGLPPLAGFFGKLYVFLAAVQAGYVWLAVLGVIFSVVAAFYYLRIIKVMYFDKPSERFDRVPDIGISAVLGFTGLFVLVFIIVPSSALEITKAAIQALIL